MTTEREETVPERIHYVNIQLPDPENAPPPLPQPASSPPRTTLDNLPSTDFWTKVPKEVCTYVLVLLLPVRVSES